MKTKFFLVFSFLSVSLFAQKEHQYASTGQQKLLINPSFAGNSRGLNLQTINSISRSGSYFTNYTGADYGGKNFSYAIANTFNRFDLGIYTSEQLDITTAYKIKLNHKLTLIPSLQSSYFTRKIDGNKIPFETLMKIDQNIPYYSWASYSQQDYHVIRRKYNFSASSGLLLDINKKLTFGVAVYDINQPDRGLLGTQKIALSQIYHISGILFAEKKVQLQPYSVLKLQREGNRYYEVGAFTSYKIISVHTGFRNEITYNFKDISSVRSQWAYILLGTNITYKKIKIGYTFMQIDGYRGSHELFLSANLFNKDNSKQRSLMLN